MKMPTQATAVQRTVTPTKVAAGIVPAGLACKLCDLLPEPARTLCRIAAC
jgi:hypothetical protein